jgi:hypothetical protein
LGVAVTFTVSPILYFPPVVLTEPPSPEIKVIVYLLITASGVFSGITSVKISSEEQETSKENRIKKSSNFINKT